MRKLRVLVMMDEALVPPDSVDHLSAHEIAPFKTEQDVLTALRSLGHYVRPVGVKTDLDVLSNAIEDFQPHICFNLVEDFDGIPNRDQHIVSYLELIDQPYSGCNPSGLTIARDKGICKKILSYHGISVPRFAEFPLGRAIRLPREFIFPALVKSLGEEGSVGISQASIVHDADELFARVSFLHGKHGTHAIAEQYIDGRELYVSVLGNRRLQSFPVL
jgi:D-alanine-D-alanine ligase